MIRRSLFLLAVPILASCATAAPTLHLLAHAAPSSVRELGPDQRARSDERVLLRIDSDRPAYLYTVWYAPAGESELLSPRSPVVTSVPARSVEVPLPTFDALHGEQTELHLYVVKSDSPMDASMCALLRLRCQTPSDNSKHRGNEPEKKDTRSTTDSGSKPAQPRENKPKDDRGDPLLPDSSRFPSLSPGIRTPATITPLVLSYRRAN